MSGPFYCKRKPKQTEKKVKSKGEMTLIWKMRRNSISVRKIPSFACFFFVVLSGIKNEFF